DGSAFLARDRFGKVPLVVLREGRRFSWSSERKAWEGKRGGLAVTLGAGCLLDLTTAEVIRWCSQVGDGNGKEKQDDLPDDLPAAVLEMLRRGVRKRLAADAPV